MGPVPTLTPEARASKPDDGQVLGVGPVEPQRALELLGRVVDGLEAERTPRPLVTDETGGARTVVDFGSGGPPSDAALQYLPPDRLSGRDERSTDVVYLLSALLYRFVTGSVPFPHARGRAVLFWHAHAPRPLATELRPELPDGIDDVIARGMAIDPEARHPTPRALIEDARRALAPSIGVSPRAPAAAPPRPADPVRRGRRKALVPLLVAVGTLAAGAAGYVVAGALDDPPPRLLRASAGPLQLGAPGDWTRSDTAAAPFAQVLADPVSLAPPGASATRLVAGLATAAASVDLVASADASPPSGELVALGEVRARRYRAARLPGLSGPATIYLAPADRGIATVVCLAPDPQLATSFIPGCERVAGSLRLTGGPGAPAGPSSRQAVGVRRAFRQVNAARSRYRSRLERSRTASAQATAAGALARVHEREARALRSLRLVGLAQPGGQAAVSALERAAAAYRAAARAGVAGDRGGYAAAGRSTTSADAALRRAQRLLRTVGYEV